MLLMALTFVLAQVPPPPQVLVPGTVYDAELVEAVAGHEAIEICEEVAAPTTVELEGRRLDSDRRLRPSQCESPFVIVGTHPNPGQRIATADQVLDRETGETVVGLGDEVFRLRWTPYSDGGVRLTLLYSDGFTHPLFESPAPAATSDVVWAGDLNGDGRLDLVLEASEGFTTFQQLMVSGEDGIPRIVAETITASR